MRVDYVQHWGDELIVVNAARVSFDKKSEWELEIDPRQPQGTITAALYPTIRKLSDKDTKLVNYLAKHKHTSCFEHMGATLKLKIPIFVARQIQRHRTFSYNEISRRYVDNPPEFYTPDTWRGRAQNAKQGSSNEEIVAAHAVNTVVIGKALDGYNEMLRLGVAPEMARILLPQSMYTEFYMTGNLRAWSHFLQLRLDEHTQNETRQVAEMVKEILEPLFPVSMKALMEN